MGRTANPSSLSTDQQDILDAIEDDSYFVDNESPSGTKNGVNTTFTLAYTPNPTDSLKLSLNGQLLKAGGEDYTLTGNSVELTLAPYASDILLASYRVDPT